jgi:phosphatidyl-myo-inositol dimannoside synthase
MRILALATDAYGGDGGIARYNRDWLGALSASEVDLLLMTSANPWREDVPAHVRIRHAASSRFGFVLAVLSAFRGQRPDWVWCGHLHLAPLAALLSWRWCAPMWLQVHGIEAWQAPSRWRFWAANRAALITAVSRHTRRELLGWWSGAPERVCVLANTVSETFCPAVVLRKVVQDAPVLLTVGRLSAAERYKGQDRVLRLLPSILQTHGRATYLIAGDGDDRQRLQQLAESLGVAERVRFIGYVPTEDLPDLYRSADVMVMPSTGEGFGIAFLEAMACGTPAIGLLGDGSADALRDGALGVCVDEANLLRSILAVLSSTISRNELSARTQRAFGRSLFEAQCRRLADRVKEGVL